MRISEISAGLEVEGEMETRRVSNSPDEVALDLVRVAPTVGLGFQGAIYHPNLLQFEIATLNGYGWQQTDLSGPSAHGSRSSRGEESWLQRYDGRFTFLQEKPYAVTFFANKGRNFRDIDFFDRVIVDNEGFGGTAGNRVGSVPFTVSVSHQEQEETGFFRDLSLSENTVTLSASNTRRSGNTTLSYALNEFKRNELVTVPQTGLNHSLNLFDAEAFGKDDFVSLQSSFFFNRLDNSNLRTDGLTIQEHGRVKHSPSLESDYHLGFDSRSSGLTENETEQGRASLRHQIRQSLTSIVDVDVQNSDSGGPESSLSIMRPSVGLSESYSKRLAGWGRLSLGYGFRFSHEDRESTGRFVEIINEQHALKDGAITFLTQPNAVRMTIRVYQPGGTRTYSELLDYLVLERGASTEIERVPGGGIPNGTTVAVDYRAAAAPSTSFTTTANRAQVRLDLFKTVGLYGQVNFIDHQGGDVSVQLQEVADELAGVDITWRWVHAGAEYEIFDSNLTPFNSLRLFETFTFEPSENTILTLDCGQSRQRFPDNDITQTTYHFITRFQWRATQYFNYELEGGVRITRGRGLDQQLGLVRTGIDYSYGKLTASLGYEFRDEDYLGELRQRHFMFLRVKRMF